MTASVPPLSILRWRAGIQRPPCLKPPTIRRQRLGCQRPRVYLLDRVRGRFEVPALRQQITTLAQCWKVDQTIVEDGDMGRAYRAGPSTIRVLRRSPEEGAARHKQARFLTQSARFEFGQVHVPQDAPWLAEWLDELLAFPNGGAMTTRSISTEPGFGLPVRSARTLYKLQESSASVRRSFIARPASNGPKGGLHHREVPNPELRGAYSPLWIT